MDVKHEFLHLVSAARNSLAGLKVALRETAFRQEVFGGLLHYAMIALIDVPFTAKMILAILWPLILSAELINSAVEQVVDHISPEWNEFAKKAKDMSSAAVGVLIMLTICIWGWILVRF